MLKDLKALWKEVQVIELDRTEHATMDFSEQQRALYSWSGSFKSEQQKLQTQFVKKNTCTLTANFLLPHSPLKHRNFTSHVCVQSAIKHS